MAFLKANVLCSLKSVKSKIAYVTSCISVFVHIVHVDNLCRDFLVRIGNGRALHPAHYIAHCWKIILFSNKGNSQIYYFVRMFSLSGKERSELQGEFYWEM